jgi:hypothetical protein
MHAFGVIHEVADHAGSDLDPCGTNQALVLIGDQITVVVAVTREGVVSVAALEANLDATIG